MTARNSTPCRATTAADTRDDADARVANGLSATIMLDTPIRRGDQVITEVSVRKPLAGELRGLSLQELLTLKVDALQALLPRITQPMLHKAEVANLDPADLVTLGSEVITFLLTKSQRAELPTG